MRFLAAISNSKQFSEINGPDGSLRLVSIGCEVALRDVYAKVRFGEDEVAEDGA